MTEWEEWVAPSNKGFHQRLVWNEGMIYANTCGKEHSILRSSRANARARVGVCVMCSRNCTEATVTSAKRHHLGYWCSHVTLVQGQAELSEDLIQYDPEGDTSDFETTSLLSYLLINFLKVNATKSALNYDEVVQITLSAVL